MIVSPLIAKGDDLDIFSLNSSAEGLQYISNHAHQAWPEQTDVLDRY